MEMLEFCRRHRLPTNDIWLFGTPALATTARTALDVAASSGSPTAEILSSLDNLVDSAAAGSAVKIAGTYPHADWQGTRIEGFVVSQGESVSDEYSSRMAAVGQQLAEQVVPFAQFGDSADLLRPATAELGDQATVLASDSDELASPRISPDQSARAGEFLEV